MKLEDLTKLGIAEETAKQVMALSEGDVNAEKQKLADKEAELKMASDKISELSETVKKFDGVDVEKLRADLAAAEKKYADDTAALKLDGALNAALADSGAIDKDIVKGLIDRSLVKLDGEKLLGFSEQLDKLKSEKAFLFSEQKPAGMTATLGAEHNSPAAPDGELTLGSALADHYKI